MLPKHYKYTRTPSAQNSIAQRELRDIAGGIINGMLVFERTGDNTVLRAMQAEREAWNELYCFFKWTEAMQAAWEACHPQWDFGTLDQELSLAFMQLQTQRLAIDPDLCLAMLYWLEQQWAQAEGSPFATGRGRFVENADGSPSLVIRSDDIDHMRRLHICTQETGEGFYVY